MGESNRLVGIHIREVASTKGLWLRPTPKKAFNQSFIIILTRGILSTGSGRVPSSAGLLVIRTTESSFCAWAECTTLGSMTT